MASLGNLVAGVAHEVNTPIGAFSSAADTLKRCIGRICTIVNDATSAEEIQKDRQYQRAMKVLSETTDTAVVAGKRVTTIVDIMARALSNDPRALPEASGSNGAEPHRTVQAGPTLDRGWVPMVDPDSAEDLHQSYFQYQLDPCAPSLHTQEHGQATIHGYILDDVQH